MKCPECGAQVSAEEKFCGNCGAPVPGDQPAAAPDLEPEVPASDETIMSAPPLPPAPEPEPQPEPEPFPMAEELDVDPPAQEIPLPPPPPPARPPAEPRQAPLPPAAPPPAEGQGKSKTGLIIAIVVVVLLLICCCCIGATAIFLTSDAGQDLLYELGISMIAPALSALI